MVMADRLRLLLFRLCPNYILRRILPQIKGYQYFKETLHTQTPITFDRWYQQKVMGHHRSVYWPVHQTSTVVNWKNIYCGIETCPGYSPGNYIQGLGKIYIGDYTQIAANVGLISSNHDVYDNSKHIIEEIRIGKYCWIGMGAIILPGVVLGDFTIVAAGAIVSKSFEKGYCVIAGVPAKEIRQLEPSKCVRSKSTFEYNGYIKSCDFESFRTQNLNI